MPILCCLGAHLSYQHVNCCLNQTEKDASSLLKNIDRLSEVVIQNDNISATQFTGSNFGKKEFATFLSL